MMQDFLVAWINWYYGKDNPYPIDILEKLPHTEWTEATAKIEQIKKIVGRPR